MNRLKPHSSKNPQFLLRFYYDWRNQYAPFCHLRYIFNKLNGNFKPRKSCQNTANQGILGGKFIMIKILFVCHVSTPDSRELAALVGQNRANRSSWESGLLRFYYEWGNEKRAFTSSPFFRDLLFGFTSLGCLLRFCKQAFSQKHGLAVGKA